MSKPTIDEIIEGYYRWQVSVFNMTLGAIGHPRIEGTGSAEPLGPEQAKQQLTDLIADIIGPDAKIHDHFDRYHNKQLAKQRQRAKERGVEL